MSSTRDYKRKVIRMDPDCAICHAPASMACDCEAKGLEVAIKQAEHRMMQSMYNDIRTWVRGHAQDYILNYFRMLSDRRKQAHAAHLDRLTAYAYQYYHAPPHPNEIAQAQASFKRGIDEDWQASVQRYPEVLEYFYSLVVFTLPSDDEPAVKDPPLSAMDGSRKAARRSRALEAEPFERTMPLPRRTSPPLPPPPDRMGDRTPGPPAGLGGMGGLAGMRPPPGSRRFQVRSVPPPPSGYYGPPAGGGY